MPVAVYDAPVEVVERRKALVVAIAVSLGLSLVTSATCVLVALWLIERFISHCR